MYRMSPVNWSFMAKRPAGHLELVDAAADDPQRDKDHAGLISMHGSIHGPGGNGKVVPYPPAAPTILLVRHEPEGGSAQTEAGPPAGLALLSTNLCKALDVVGSQGPVVGGRAAKAAVSAAEVTWAVQVLDKLIALAKQCHAVPKKSSLELAARPRRKMLHDEQIMVLRMVGAPSSPAASGSSEGEGGVFDRPYSLDEVDVEASPPPVEDEEFEYASPKLVRGWAPEHGRSDVERAAEGEVAMASLELPELETVFSDTDSGSSSDEDGLRVLYPLQRIAEEPETDEDIAKMGGASECPSEPPGERCVGGPAEPESATPVTRESETAQNGMSTTPVLAATRMLEPIGKGYRDTPNTEQPKNATSVPAAPPPQRKTKFELLTKLEVGIVVSHEPPAEERELRYVSQKMTELEFQDEPSFRLWECESPPPLSQRRRTSQAVSRDFQESDTQDSHYLGFADASRPQQVSDRTFPSESAGPSDSDGDGNRDSYSFDDIRDEFQRFPPQSLAELETSDALFNEKEPFIFTETGARDGGEFCDDGCPSPSSFTHERSPTSVFSDDQPFAVEPPPPFRWGPNKKLEPELEFPQSAALMYHSSPDEMPHAAAPSDGFPDRKEFQQPCVPEFEKPFFSKFTYTAEAMVETSSDEDPFERREADGNGADFADLQFFRDAEKWEPWLEKDGGALDRTDLEFLFPNDFKYDFESRTADRALEEGHNGGGHWVPYVTAGRGDPSLGLDSPKGRRPGGHPHEVSSQFFPSAEKVAPAGGSKGTANAEDEDENIFPSVESWDVHEDEGPPVATSRRRWPRVAEKPAPASDSFAAQARALLFVPASAKRRGPGAVPCSGRLFSWPQRIISSKGSKSSRFLDSDDERSAPGGSDRSFGRTARRDAQQIKGLLKGSQKKYASLTLGDILKQDFG